MNKTYGGYWQIIVVDALSLSPGQNLTSAFAANFYSTNSIYAIWYGVCTYDPELAFAAFYINYSFSSGIFVNTTVTDVSKVPAEANNVIRSINYAAKVDNPDLPSYNQKVASLIRSYNSKSWHVFTVMFSLNGRYPDAFARLNSNVQAWATYAGAFTTKNGTLISQMLFYYE